MVNLRKHRGQAFSLILGQCMQMLQDKMKQDTDWHTVSTSYDPLTLGCLIEKTILAQTEDQYPFATVYDQELSFYGFWQESLSNPQWYEQFNTKIDIADAIGVTRQHKVLLEYVSKETHHQAFANLMDVQQEAIGKDAEERYVSYAFLRQSGTQHGKLKVDLQNDFTTGDNRYPKDRQQMLHLLDKYSKTVVPKMTPSEGTLFAQRNGKGDKDGNKEPFNKKFWKEKKCFKCHKIGHPALHCPDKDEDDKSIASTASSVKKLQKDLKSLNKKFTMVNTQLQELKEDDSDLSDSDSELGTNHLLFKRGAFQFTQVEDVFEPRIAKLFKQMHGTKIKLDLKEVILLDSQSMIDLFCNKSLVGNAGKSSSPMQLQSNGGTMVVTKKAKMPGYHAKVWFSNQAITNIIALRNLIKQYHVTYDSYELSFVVHREAENKPNMEFIMHKSGLHYYDPRKDMQYMFINTVSRKQGRFHQETDCACRSCKNFVCHVGLSIHDGL